LARHFIRQPAIHPEAFDNKRGPEVGLVGRLSLSRKVLICQMNTSAVSICGMCPHSAISTNCAPAMLD
jgi:hypothetical protein